MQRKWAARNPEKVAAHAKVSEAVRTGRFHRPNVCESCGANEFTEAAHTDYSEPLTVEWLCRSCHRRKDFGG